jgi:hypothetical protein
MLRLEEDEKFDGSHWMFPCGKGKSEQVAIDAADFPDFSLDVLNYHIALLVSADFVTSMRSGLGGTLRISSLTWDGHEFLDNIKNNDIWEKTKNRISDLPGIALKVVAAIAQAEMMKKLGLG